MQKRVSILLLVGLVAVLSGCVRLAFLGRVPALPRSAWRSQVSAGSTIRLTGIPHEGEDAFEITYAIPAEPSRSRPLILRTDVVLARDRAARHAGSLFG